MVLEWEAGVARGDLGAGISKTVLDLSVCNLVMRHPIELGIELIIECDLLFNLLT